LYSNNEEEKEIFSNSHNKLIFGIQYRRQTLPGRKGPATARSCQIYNPALLADCNKFSVDFYSQSCIIPCFGKRLFIKVLNKFLDLLLKGFYD